MNARRYTTSTGNQESVEDLIRYASRVFAANGVEFRPARMSRLIRREHKSQGDAHVRRLIDTFVARALYKLTWRGFELFTAVGVADPTGARAAQNVDRSRGAL